MIEKNRIEPNAQSSVLRKLLRANSDGRSSSFQEELLNLRFASSQATQELEESTSKVTTLPIASPADTRDDRDRRFEQDSNDEKSTESNPSVVLVQQLVPIEDSQNGSHTRLDDLSTVLSDESLNKNSKDDQSFAIDSTREITASSDRELRVGDDRDLFPQTAQSVANVDRSLTVTYESSIGEGPLAANEQTSSPETFLREIVVDSSALPKDGKQNDHDSTVDLNQQLDETTENVRIVSGKSSNHPESGISLEGFEAIKKFEITAGKGRRAERLERARSETARESAGKQDNREPYIGSDVEADFRVGDTIKQIESVLDVALTEDPNIAHSSFSAVKESSTNVQLEIDPSLVSSVTASAASVASPIVTSSIQSTADSTSLNNSFTGVSGVGTEFSISNKGMGATLASRGPKLSTFQELKLVQRVLRGFEQLNTSGGQVKLRLHPPELGTLQMTLKIQATQVSAHLEVENSLARDALLNQVQVLRDRLIEQGMTIDRFDVEVRAESQMTGQNAFADSEKQQMWEQSESRYAILNDNRLAADDKESKPAVPWFRTSGILDLSV